MNTNHPRKHSWLFLLIIITIGIISFPFKAVLSANTLTIFKGNEDLSTKVQVAQESSKELGGNKMTSVQIVENWSDVTGVVRSYQPAADTIGFMAVELTVQKVSPVEGFTNLLEQLEGKSLVVLMPEELVKPLNIGLGDIITCRVRRAGTNRVFVHRDHLSIQPARSE